VRYGLVEFGKMCILLARSRNRCSPRSKSEPAGSGAARDLPGASHQQVLQINEPGQDQQPDEPVGVAVPSELDPKVAS
jgi:hypothetical protein